MVVDSIKKLIFYFSSSKVFSKSDDGGSIDTTTTTMSTAIASGDEEEQSLYTIVENSLKDNVSKCEVTMNVAITLALERKPNLYSVVTTHVEMCERARVMALPHLFTCGMSSILLFCSFVALLFTHKPY